MVQWCRQSSSEFELRRWRRHCRPVGSAIAGANVHAAASDRAQCAADTSGCRDTGHHRAATTGSDCFRHRSSTATKRSTRSGHHREQSADRFATSSATNIHGRFTRANRHDGSNTVFHRLFARDHDSTTSSSDLCRVRAGACDHHCSTEPAAKFHGRCRAKSSTGGRAKSGAASHSFENAAGHPLFDSFAETAEPIVRATSETAGYACRGSEAEAATNRAEAQGSRRRVQPQDTGDPSTGRITPRHR